MLCAVTNCKPVLGFSSQDKETLDYAQVKNCTFINNKAIQFGGAFVATSFVTMSYKTKNRTLDIHDWYVYRYKKKKVV